MRTTRRKFIMGCSTAIAAMAGSRLNSMVFAAPDDPNLSNETLVMIFLRGGMDGLNLVPPIAGPDRSHYESARPRLKLPTTGPDAALALNGAFGLHPAAWSLYPYFTDGKLAIIQGVGSGGSRSHFDAMKYMELGTPGIQSTGSGWLTRHLNSAPNLPDRILMPTMAVGSQPPTSLQGSLETLTMSDPGSFSLDQIGHSSWRGAPQRTVLRRLFTMDSGPVQEAGLQAMNAADLIDSYVHDDYLPSHGASYPNNSFGRQLRMIAQMIKLDVGLRVVTVDLGGWDTHTDQGEGSTGYFGTQVQTLADGMAALYQDLDTAQSDSPANRLTVAVQSEFGRRVRENADRGTDHGTGNVMLVMGGNVNGGVHGSWPGLAPEQLYDNADVAPTIDYRQVLSEILIRRLANPNLGEVFPGYTDYTPINIVAGSDMAPQYEAPAPDSPPRGVSIQVTENTIRVQWQMLAGSNGYRIDRRSAAGGSWSEVATPDVDVDTFEDSGLEPQVEYSYRVQAIYPHGDSIWSETVSAMTRTESEQWRFNHFGATGDAGDAADSAVLAGDGMNNLVKYALDLDPHENVSQPTSGFTPGRPRIQSVGGDVSLTYVRPVRRSGIQYAVECSEDMKSWHAIPDQSDGILDGRERRRATVSVVEKAAIFLRLQINRDSSGL